MRNSTPLVDIFLTCLLVIFTISIIIASSLPPSVEHALNHKPATLEERVASLEARMARAEKWDGWAQEWLLWWGAK